MDQLIDAMETTDRQFATTLQRGLLVLACFDVRQPFLTNKEISARTGIPSPTVSRLTYTLTLMGYLKHHRHLGKYGKYELGNAVLSLAHPCWPTSMCARLRGYRCASWPSTPTAGCRWARASG